MSIKARSVLPLSSFIVVWTSSLLRLRAVEKERERLNQLRMCALLRFSWLNCRCACFSFRAQWVHPLGTPFLLTGHSIHSLLLLCRFCSLCTPPCPHSKRPARASFLSLALERARALSLTHSFFLCLYLPLQFFLCIRLKKKK